MRFDSLKLGKMLKYTVGDMANLIIHKACVFWYNILYIQAYLLHFWEVGMKHSMKQILAMLLCALLLSQTLAGCGSVETVETSAEDADTTAQTETEAETEIRGNLPDKDFEGRAFHVYTRSAPGYPQFDAYELVSEELNGEVLNDAIYQRNAIVEEKYNLSVEQQKFEAPGSEAMKAVQSGDDGVDYVVSQVANVQKNVINGSFYDLYTGEYFNFDMPWWHETINDSCSLGGKLFMTMNDYLLLYKQQTYCLFFNKTMAKNNGLRDYYEAVIEGTWTWDMMYEDMKAVAYDLDGDGDMDQRDNYGYSCQYGQMLAAVIGCDVQYSRKDENDVPVLQADSETHINALDKVASVFIDKTTSLLANDYSSSETTGNSMWDIPLDTFYDDRVLFIGGVVRYAPGIISNSEIDFGILPNPKLSETQENYYAYSEVGNSTALLVPVVANLSDVSFVIEALSEESFHTVVPAYYEVMMKSKYSPDPNASAVLDLMFANHRFDTALLYAWLDISAIYDGILKSKNNTFVSQYTSRSKSAQTQLDKWMGQIAEME